MRNLKDFPLSNFLFGLIIIASIVAFLWYLGMISERKMAEAGKVNQEGSDSPKEWGRFRPKSEEHSSLVVIKRLHREGKEYFYIINKDQQNLYGPGGQQNPGRIIPKK